MTSQLENKTFTPKNISWDVVFSNVQLSASLSTLCSVGTASSFTSWIDWITVCPKWSYCRFSNTHLQWRKRACISKSPRPSGFIFLVETHREDCNRSTAEVKCNFLLRMFTNNLKVFLFHLVALSVSKNLCRLKKSQLGILSSLCGVKEAFSLQTFGQRIKVLHVMLNTTVCIVLFLHHFGQTWCSNIS